MSLSVYLVIFCYQSISKDYKQILKNFCGVGRFFVVFLSLLLLYWTISYCCCCSHVRPSWSSWQHFWQQPVHCRNQLFLSMAKNIVLRWIVIYTGYWTCSGICSLIWFAMGGAFKGMMRLSLRWRRLVYFVIWCCCVILLVFELISLSVLSELL